MASAGPATAATSIPAYKLTTDGPVRTFSISGWVFTTTKLPILNAGETQRLSDDLKIPLPEICFGNNSLTITHAPSGFTYAFTSSEALKRVDPNGEGEGMVKVSYADRWAESRMKDSSVKIVKPFDWTYTTTYAGDCAPEESFRNPGASHLGIPLQQLTKPDPILFFEEVVLYEDELHDNGVATTNVRIRVMPSCWFVLFRFFLRVDGVLFRMHDVRLFHAFGSSEVVREVKGRESTYDAIKRKLPPERRHDMTPLTDPGWVSNALGMLLREPDSPESAGTGWKGQGTSLQVAELHTSGTRERDP